MGQKRKILILTASYGNGHITAAKSISEAISKNLPGYETKIVDLLQFWNPQQRFPFIQKLSDFVYYCLYLSKKFHSFCLERAPFLWDICFHVTNNKFCTYILQKMLLLHEELKNLFNKYQPDLIISTHPTYSIVEEYKKGAHKNIFHLGVITDPYIIHQIWISKSVDYY